MHQKCLPSMIYVQLWHGRRWKISCFTLLLLLYVFDLLCLAGCPTQKSELAYTWGQLKILTALLGTPMQVQPSAGFGLAGCELWTITPGVRGGGGQRAALQLNFQFNLGHFGGAGSVNIRSFVLGRSWAGFWTAANLESIFNFHFICLASCYIHQQRLIFTFLILFSCQLHQFDCWWVWGY